MVFKNAIIGSAGTNNGAAFRYGNYSYFCWPRVGLTRHVSVHQNGGDLIPTLPGLIGSGLGGSAV